MQCCWYTGLYLGCIYTAGAGGAYGQGAPVLDILVGTLGTFPTIELLMLLDGEGKHIGCVDTTDDKWGFTEFSPQGKVFVPNGLGTFVAQ